MFVCLSFRLLGSGPWTLGEAKGGMVVGGDGGHHVGQEHPGLPLQGEGQ